MSLDTQVNLGNMYVQGLGVPQDLDQAMAWYKKAAEQYPDHVSELIAHLQQRIDGTLSPSTSPEAIASATAAIDTAMRGGGAGAGAPTAPADDGADVMVTALPLSAIPSTGRSVGAMEFTVQMGRGSAGSSSGSSSSPSSSSSSSSSSSGSAAAKEELK